MPDTIERPITQTMKLDDLSPADYNPRADLQPGDPDFENIKTSIETYGLIDDLVWNKQTGNLVGGHQRLKVLQQMGVESVEVKVVDLSPGMERSLNLMLNKAVGRWDDEKLVALVDELGEMEDAGPTGWADDELAVLTDGADTVDFPDMPEGDRSGDSLGTITIRLPWEDCESVRSFLDTIRPGNPSGAILEVSRRG